jgi:ketosteroid isomerase-like protein
MNERMRTIGCLLIIVIFSGCAGETKEDLKTRAKQEILQTEKAFQQMAREKGLREAFVFYADENAAIIRGEHIIKGKKAIQSWYDKRSGSKMELNWTPDFVDVSGSCDLGYTYGRYVFVVTDSTGARKEGKGIFHTVWKKQPDGTWKYVWD